MSSEYGSIARTAGSAARSSGYRAGGGPQPANLGDILERVLDTGIVIAGDIRVNLLDIELLTIKLRLVIASVDTARELGIDWWRSDPWLTSQSRENARGRALDSAGDGREVEKDVGHRQLAGGPGRHELEEHAGSGEAAEQAAGRDLAEENRRLRARLAEIEGKDSYG